MKKVKLNDKLSYIVRSLNVIKIFLKKANIRKYSYILLILYLFIAILNVYTANSLGKIVNNAIYLDQNLLIKSLLIFTVFKLLLALSSFIAEILCSKVKQILKYKYRVLTVQSLLEASYEWVQENKVGDFLGRIQENINNVADALADFLPNILRRILVSLFAIISLFYIDYRFGITFIIFIPLVFIFQMLGGYYSEKYLSKMQISASERNSMFQDVISHKLVIISLRAENKVNQWLKTKIDKYIKDFTKAMTIMTTAFSPAIILNQLPLIISCGIGCYLAKYNLINIESFITVLSLVLVASNELRGFNDIFANLPTILVGGERLFYIWDAPKEESGKISEGLDTFPMEFNNVTYSYAESNKETIKSISFKVKKGEKLAIVGPSGCGKSTLLKLMAGIYRPQKGKIYAWGVDINEWDINSLRSKIGLINQDVYLFSSNVVNNLVFDDSHNNSDINEALKSAQLLEFIDRLPKGLDTIIEENGGNVSGGEKQRIGLARALIKKSPLILLDEATSALDLNTEENINKYLLSLSNEYTIITVTHRLYSIKEYDRIIVIENGKIVEEGKHQELIDKSGLYRKMFYNDKKGDLNDE
jgi:ABC-type multidrug transport system fused ATPase/permease subunit